MTRRALPLLFLSICLAALVISGALRETSPVKAATPPESSQAYTPTYTAAGDLVPPLDYRQWVYLTTGFNMSYLPKPSGGMDMFDNVFVNPEAYRAFQETGTWPDKTVIVLEGRAATSRGSINTSGHYQSGGVMGLEVHIRDEKRFPGKWAFFHVESETKTELYPQTADCYSCHAEHAAVDTTFVQFYPTLLPIAQKKNTLSPKYLQEIAPAATK